MFKLGIFALILSLLTGCAPSSKDENIKPSNPVETEGITIVPTMQDEIVTDTAWCGTFQLVWNDMKNEVVKQDIVFNPQLKVVENLNAETFKASMLSDEYYFKAFGPKTIALKEKIEKGIKDKFNETSAILNDFSWESADLADESSDKISSYFFYAMLKREFKFPKVFTVLNNGTFANKYENTKYFGIDNSTNKNVFDQVRVLYYNSQDDFAIILKTENNDDVVLCKSPKGDTLEEIYNNMIANSETYEGKKYMAEIDRLKVPYVSFNEKKTYDELANKPFLTADGKPVMIDKGIQTIEFDLDEKGGKIKSEAAIDLKVTSMAPSDIPTPRYFYVDDTFAMFLKESDKDTPYFGVKISDITKFQK